MSSAHRGHHTQVCSELIPVWLTGSTLRCPRYRSFFDWQTFCSAGSHNTDPSSVRNGSARDGLSSTELGQFTLHSVAASVRGHTVPHD